MSGDAMEVCTTGLSPAPSTGTLTERNTSGSTRPGAPTTARLTVLLGTGMSSGDGSSSGTTLPLVEALNPKGRAKEIHRQATRLVVDDFGNAVGVLWRCWGCCRWRSEERCRGLCSTCRPWHGRMHRQRAGEELLERKRRQRQERLAADELARVRERELHRQANQARMERDPEGERAKVRVRNARYRERVRADPVRYQEYLEKARIDNGLRRMRQGLSVGNGHRRTTVPRREYVPVAPAVALIVRQTVCNGEPLEDAERQLSERAGVTPRLLYAWRSGERRGARAESVERVMLALDVLWWEVFDPELAPGCFSATRSRDVVAWSEAMLRACELWGDG